MDLRFTPEELAFRDEVRAFFRANLPASIRDKLVAGKHLAKDDTIAWQRIGRSSGAAPAGRRFSNTCFRTSCNKPRRRSRSASV
jgi:hypothetical protein